MAKQEATPESEIGRMVTNYYDRDPSELPPPDGD